MFSRVSINFVYTTVSFFLICICISLLACAGEIDQNDELGLRDESNIRTEVVLLDKSLSMNNEQKEGKIDSIRNGVLDARISNAMGDAQNKESLVENSSSKTSDPDHGYVKAIFYDPEGLFTVQVAGYNDAIKAKDLLRRLVNDGYPAYITKRDGMGEVRVRIGYFSSFKDASNFGNLLRKDRDLEFWVDRRENE